MLRTRVKRQKQPLLPVTRLYVIHLVAHLLVLTYPTHQVEKAFKSIGSITDTILQEAQDYVTTERKSLQDAKAMADSTTQAEIARLQSQNVLLMRAVEAEKGKTERAKDDLVKRMVALFDTFTAERARSLRETFSELAESNTAAEAGMAKLGKDQGQRLESVISRGKELSGSLDKRASESKRLRDGGLKASIAL